MAGSRHAAEGPDECDLIVSNGNVLTLDDQRSVYHPGAVAISGTRIVAVGREVDVLASFRSETIIDALGAPVHPGFIEGHNHIGQHSSRGIDALLARNPRSTVNYAAWKAEMRDEDEYASTSLGSLDLLLHGYTGFVEAGTALNPDAVAAAAEEMGIRGWISDPYLWDCRDIMDSAPSLINPALVARAPFDLDRCIRELGLQLKRNRNENALVRGYVALYGLGTASDELQRAAKEVADQNGVTSAQHAGYVIGMTEWAEARLGRPYLVHLADLGVLDPRSLLVHLNVVRDAEIGPLTESGASVVWCPANYLFFAARDGVRGRMPDFHRLGVRLCLGVDTAKYCSVGDTGCLALHAAAQCGTVLSAESILDMLTINAARAIGAEQDVGSIEAGKRADLVVRKDNAPDAQPILDAVFQIAVLGRTGSVDTVIVNGAIVVRHGQSIIVSEEEVYRKVQISIDGMTARLGLSR